MFVSFTSHRRVVPVFALIARGSGGSPETRSSGISAVSHIKKRQKPRNPIATEAKWEGSQALDNCSLRIAIGSAVGGTASAFYGFNLGGAVPAVAQLVSSSYHAASSSLSASRPVSSEDDKKIPNKSTTSTL
ncbi:hypothetical protein C5167_003215 [Papaver somniferum]|uniref:Uncharacterized protein n=1 Tax=Papaver somniferum TaxID=3469 RepID=A0A4Y7L1E7_PAPSO|nr:hypothetical protein C5167_003215 [Papaver somniferum]